MFQDVEPFYGWLPFYDQKTDEQSPFYDVEHSLFQYDRYVYTFECHPLWDFIESESLLVKTLYVEYDEGYAILELFGEWNDLFDNDFRLLIANCLDAFVYAGVNKFIFICENVFNVYLDSNDYYEDFSDQLDDGWMCLIRGREQVLQEFQNYNISPYFFWSDALSSLAWRKLKPWELYQMVNKSMAIPLIGN